MGARKQTIKIISFVCCAAIVAGIVTAKVREFSDNSTESVQEQAQKEENLEDTKNTTDKKTPDGKQGIKIIHRFIRHGCDLQFDFVICHNNPSCSQDK